MATKEIIIKAAEIKKYIADLPISGPFGKELKFNDDRSVIIIQSITSNDPSVQAEIHDNLIDIFLIKEGREELFIGGEITDKQEIEPGEWRGGKSYQSKKISCRNW